MFKLVSGQLPPLSKIPPGYGWGFGQGQGQFQGWGWATRLLPPRKIVPQLRLGVGLGLVLGLGAGAIFLEPSKLNPLCDNKTAHCKKSFALFLSCEFCESVNSTYLVKHFDRHKMTTENNFPFSQTSVFFELGITKGAQSGHLVLASIEK